MRNLKAICVDDEFPALELIAQYCEQIPEIDLIGSFNHAADAIQFLDNNEVDLLILDIQMPEMSGVELLNKVSPDKLCIFITADPGHAVTAYELDVIDYLIKPVLQERFTKAILKAADYRKYLENSNEEEYIVFKSDYMINKLRVDHIEWIEGYGEYVKIISRFRKYLVLLRFADFLEKYKHLGFIRIHKSYIVLKKNIKSYNSQLVVLKNGKELPVGRTFKGNL
jgi:two-component system response regulator LytT